MNRFLAQLLAAPTAAGMLFLMPAGIAQASSHDQNGNSSHLVDPSSLTSSLTSSLIGGLGGSLGGVGLLYLFLLRETKAKVENIEEDIEKLNHEGIGNLKTDLKDKTNSLESTIKTVSTELQSQVKDVNNAVEKIQGSIPQINKTYEQMDSKINKFNADFDLLARTIKTEVIEADSKISNRIIDLKETLKNSLDTSQEKLETQITKLKSSIQKLSNDQVPELRKTVKGIEINVKDIEIDMNSIKDRLDTLDA